MEEIVLDPALRGALGDDLLGQYVQRERGWLDGVQAASVHPGQ
jgi:hypothetical protein